MRIFKILALAAGLATLLILLIRLDASTVWSHISLSGPGLGLVLLIPIADHLINVYGWRFAFKAEDAGNLSMRRLFNARVAGDGINYLTPSATIAGEIVRPAIMGPGASLEAKIASVVVARFTQSLGQALFIMLSLMLTVWLCPPQLEAAPLIKVIRSYLSLPIGISLALFLGLAVYAFIARRKRAQAPAPAPTLKTGVTDFAKVKRQVQAYFTAHPGRFTISILFFAAGYFLGAVETWMIGWFMGADISPYLALTIETCSSAFEGFFFLIPAKIGTQEAGKTAIFKGLGLDPAQGLALALIRHCREIMWAGLGLGLYAWAWEGKAKKNLS